MGDLATVTRSVFTAEAPQALRDAMKAGLNARWDASKIGQYHEPAWQLPPAWSDGGGLVCVHPPPTETIHMLVESHDVQVYVAKAQSQKFVVKRCVCAL